jgi:hypothetical protein
MVVPRCFLNYGGSNVVMQRERQNPSKVLSSWHLSFRKREIEPIKGFVIMALVIQKERDRTHQRFCHYQACDTKRENPSKVLDLMQKSHLHMVIK